MHDAELPLSAPANALTDSPFHEPTKDIRDRLRRICAWCRRVSVDGLQWSDDRWSGTDLVTHGICPMCAADFDQG